MLLSLYQVVLPVADIDEADKFYNHLLGDTWSKGFSGPTSL